MKKFITMFLLVVTLLGLVSCGKTETEIESGSESVSESETEKQTELILESDAENEYLASHSDYDAANAWLKANIEDASHPPVEFTVDGKSSNELTWKKEVGEKREYIDYPNDDPVRRYAYTIKYICDEYHIEVDAEITSYPQYPIIEYECTLVNLSDGNSAEMKNLYAINGNLLDTSAVTLNYCAGSDDDGDTDYVSYEEKFPASGTKRFNLSVTNGKPTSTYMPCFNIEKDDKSGGVIAVMGWQGNWNAIFNSTKEGSFTLKAGQYKTDFVLTKGETHRFPMMVLLYYKDSEEYGQNIYRKWWYNHNLLRKEGVRLDQFVLLAAAPRDYAGIYDVQSNAEADLKAIEHFVKYGVKKYGDTFVQDAGWYNYDGAANWSLAVGEWTVDKTRYPNGLKEISDAAHENGLKYMLWLEPERAMVGTKTAEDLSEYMIHMRTKGGKNVYLEPEKAGKGGYGMVNIGKTEACDYIINMLDDLFKEQGVDVYRQDFNYFPAPYWEAYDGYEEEQMNIKRVGRTEEQYCNGYLRVFDTLIERNPGLLIDACASGGMRYDIATARRAFMHTLTDWYNVSAEKAQSDCYTASKWYSFYGRGFTGGSDYQIVSNVSGDTCVGAIVSPKRTAQEDKEFEAGNVKELSIWGVINDYTTDEYYPLTDYIDRNSKKVMAMQYHLGDEGKGVVLVYFRSRGEFKAEPYGIDPDASYSIFDPKNPSARSVVTGKQLLEEKMNFKGGDGTAYVIVYEELKKRS